MIEFLGLATVFSFIILFFLSVKQIRNINRKKISNNSKYVLIKKKMVGNLLITVSCFIIIVAILPYFLWCTGEKEIKSVDKVEQKKQLYPITKEEKNYYAGEYYLENRKLFEINTSNQKNPMMETVDSADLEIIYTKNKEECRVEKISEYKIKKLKSDSMVSTAVNDMYANIYQLSCDGEKRENKEVLFVKTKGKLYIPNGGIKVNYQVEKK